MFTRTIDAALPARAGFEDTKKNAGANRRLHDTEMGLHQLRTTAERTQAAPGSVCFEVAVAMGWVWPAECEAVWWLGQAMRSFAGPVKGGQTGLGAAQRPVLRSTGGVFFI